jgi:hypothetical protein
MRNIFTYVSPTDGTVYNVEDGGIPHINARNARLAEKRAGEAEIRGYDEVQRMLHILSGRQPKPGAPTETSRIAKYLSSLETPCEVFVGDIAQATKLPREVVRLRINNFIAPRSAECAPYLGFVVYFVDKESDYTAVTRESDAVRPAKPARKAKMLPAPVAETVESESDAA